MLVAAALAAVAQGGSARTTSRAEFESADVAVEAVRSFQKLTVEGCSTLSEVGEPELPVRVVRFVIPATSRVEDVVVSLLEEEELPGTYRVVPTQPDVPIGEAAEWADPDPAIYESDAPFPGSHVRYLGDGYLGGYRIASVAIYPLTYAPRTGKLTLARDISVELVLGQGADRSHPRQRTTARSDALYKSLVEGLVENPEDVAGRLSGSVEVVDDFGPDGFLPRYTPSLEGSPVEYVIITTDEFASQFQELADRKTRKGVPAVVRTISWIESNYPGGCDTPERIRLFIRDAFASWGTTYVLLGGDTGVVPVRFASTAYYGGEEIPCDLYYGDLDGNWNDDGDALFGEAYAGPTSPGDSIDFYPDVFVGRAPVSSVVEIETFLDKCERYETDPVRHFTDRNLYLAEVVFPYDWESGPYSLDGAADVIEPMLPSIPTTIRNVRLYANTVEYPDAYPLSASAAIDSLDAGYNLVVHVGHGNKDVMRVGQDNYITMADASGLANGIEKASFAWLLNCSSASIDADCIAERAVNNPDGGAIALFGTTRYAFPATLRGYLYDWVDLLYNEPVTQIGAISAMSKAAHASPEESEHENPNRWTQFCTLLLGDPELSLWTRRPGSLSVLHSSSMNVGDEGLTVSVTGSGPLEGALVCAYKNGDVYGYGVTGPAGQVVLDVVPHSTGTILVTVTAPDYIPKESSVSVTPAAGAYVHLVEAVPDDDGAGGSYGNGNGAAESGETIELDVEIRNGGTVLASGVTATLSSLDPYVTIEQTIALAGDVGGGSSVVVDEAFRLSIDPDCPNEHDVIFTIDFAEVDDRESDDNGRRFPCAPEGRAAWSEEFTVRVCRAELLSLRVDFDDSAGNGNGVPDAGETVDLVIGLWNDGNGDAEGVTGTLRYPSHHVTLIDSSASWGSVPAGATVSASDGFRFFVNQAISERFEVVLAGTYGATWSVSIDVYPPSAPSGLSGRVRGTTIELSWEPVDESDLRGYDIYRAEHVAGPYTMANDALIEGSSYFSDPDLAENTLYHYYVAAVDSSGNTSAASEILSLSTNPPSQSGWPLATASAMYSSPTIVDIDGDGELEVLISSDEIYAWHADGSEVVDGDGDPRTVGILADDGDGGYRSSVAVGEIDGDAGVEIVCAAWADVGPEGSAQYAVYVWNGEDGSVVPGWPVYTKKFCWASPALADFDLDGRSEIVLPCADGNLYCWRPDGSELIDGDDDPSTTGVFAWLGGKWVYGSPAIADLDGDLVPEIVQPALNDSVYAFHADGSRVAGWPIHVGARSFSSPAIGDVDNDGELEIAIGSNFERVWLVEADGTIMDGWPQVLTLEGDFPPSPVLADIAGDGFLEVVLVGSDGEVIVRDYQGLALPGWPQQINAYCASSAAVADIDGDPGMEIVVGSHDGRVYCFDADGDLLRGWPIQTEAEIFSSPAVADLDGDGDNEVIVGSMDTIVYAWDCEGDYDDGDGVQWGMFLHDPQRTQSYGFVAPTGIDEGDDEWNGGRRVALEQNSPNPFNPVTTIAFAVPAIGGSSVDAALAIYSVDGRLVNVLVDGPLSGGEHSVTWDGRDGSGNRVASGIYLYRLTVDGESASRKMTLLK